MAIRTHLTDDERGEAHRLFTEDKLTISDIAKQLGRSRQTISQFLATFKDTRKEALDHLRGQALRMAKHVVEDGTPKDHIEVLQDKQIGVLSPRHDGGIGGPRLVVMIGGLTPPSDVELGLVPAPIALPPGDDTA